MLRLVSTGPSADIFSLNRNQSYHVRKLHGKIIINTVSSNTVPVPIQVLAVLTAEHSLGHMVDPELQPSLRITATDTNRVFVCDDRNQELFPLPTGVCDFRFPGHKIRFGKTHPFVIEYTPTVFVFSGMLPTPDLENDILELGGHLVRELSEETTHVVMSMFDLTPKCVTGILSAKPIVTPSYITECWRSVISSDPLYVGKLPKAEDFLPPRTKELELLQLDKAKFHPNPARKELFDGKTFLFGSQEHLDTFKPAVQAGGGEASLLDDFTRKNVLSESILIMDDTDIENAKEDPTARKIIETYEQGNRRFVSITEIGMAALHTSTQEYCNPDHKFPNAN